MDRLPVSCFVMNQFFILLRQCLSVSMLVCLLFAAGCGYSVGSSGNQVLEAGFRKVAVDEVTNNTTLAWIEPRLRSLLRDEVTRRGDLQWVDRNKADALITLAVNRFQRPTAVTGASDETLRYEAELEVEAVLRSRVDGTELWRSGKVSEKWPFFAGQESEAEDQVTALVIRTIVRRMSENY